MAELSNASPMAKISRIQEEERELLFHLRGVYGSDYKKYREHIRREPDVSLTTKAVYKLLDEHKSYRRISDFFHRIRLSQLHKKKKRTTKRTANHKSYRSISHQVSSEPESVSTMQIVEDMDNDDQDDDDVDDQHDDDDENETNTVTHEDDQNVHQQSDSSAMLNDSDVTIGTSHMREDDGQRLQPSSSISPKPNLLVVRASIQKALNELDRAIVCKSDSMADDYVSRPQRSSGSKIDLLSTGHSNLDAMVRSLSSVVNEQQDNTRFAIEQSTNLLLHDSLRSERRSIQHVLDRLNVLVDRGHAIYDRIESILSDF